MRALALAAALALVGCSSMVTMKGIVRDKNTLAPVDGAIVTVEGSGQATTNENGAYVLKVHANGQPVTVSVNAGDFFPVSDMRSFMKTEGGLLLVNFEMTAREDVVRKREGLGAGSPRVNVTTVTPTTNVSSSPASQAPSERAATFCPDCGAKLAPSAKFCTSCGRKL